MIITSSVESAPRDLCSTRSSISKGVKETHQKLNIRQKLPPDERLDLASTSKYGKKVRSTTINIVPKHMLCSNHVSFNILSFCVKQFDPFGSAFLFGPKSHQISIKSCECLVQGSCECLAQESAKKTQFLTPSKRTGGLTGTN